jgi:hypothetical protein
MSDKQIINPEDAGPVPQTLLAGLSGIDARAEIDHNQHLLDASRRTVAARAAQLSAKLADADDATNAAIMAYIAEARAAVQGDDGAAMVAWCDENRQRFWELTGQA